MVISEMPSSIWSLAPTFHLRVDRSSTTVAEYLENIGVSWDLGFHARSDVCLYKEDVGSLSFGRVKEELLRRISKRPAIRLIGEPREHARAAYIFAPRSTTMAVAPGKRFKRLYFASEWLDPQLEGWQKRSDSICWFARPTPERIELARYLISQGVPLHIYSREKWPFAQWQGYAENEVAISYRYRYRLVCENSRMAGYHSEKLFNSIRSGCVTFYFSDLSLHLPHLTGSYLQLSLENILMRQEYAPTVLQGIERVMFTADWEIYSFRRFYDRIHDLALDILE